MSSNSISANTGVAPGPAAGARLGVAPVALALLAGLILRLWFVQHTARVAGDTLIYGDIARSWLDHGIYGFSVSAGPPLPTLIRLPGYPAFLALCFALFGREHYNAVMYVQVAVDLATCLILSALAGRLFGRRAALAALWLAALCPFTASYVSAPLTETPSLACIALAFYALCRWQEACTPRDRQPATPYNRWLYLLAATLSYALLLRPEQGLLSAAILPAMLWIALNPKQPNSPPALLRSSAPVILTAILILVPLVPWTLRNQRTFHVFQPLAPRYATDPGEFIPFGFQRWFRTWGIDFASTDNVYWNYNGAPIAIGDLPTRAFDTDAEYTRTAALLAEYNLTANATPALDARFVALARERIESNPLRYYVALPVARLLDMAFRPRTEMFDVQLEWWNLRAHPGQTLIATAYGALNLAYFVFAGIGFYRWRFLDSFTRCCQLRNLGHARQHRSPRRVAPHPGQLRASLHPGILSRSNRPGLDRLHPARNSVIVHRRLLIRLNRISTQIRLAQLVVANIRIRRRLDIARRLKELLLQRHIQLRIDPDRNVREKIPRLRILRHQVQLRRLHHLFAVVLRLHPLEGDRPVLRQLRPATPKADGQEALILRLVILD